MSRMCVCTHNDGWGKRVRNDVDEFLVALAAFLLLFTFYYVITCRSLIHSRNVSRDLVYVNWNFLRTFALRERKRGKDVKASAVAEKFSFPTNLFTFVVAIA
jgi:hypothetical protein